MRLDQLNGMIALLSVAEKRSFSDAAIQLRVSPSAVSQAIKQLESRLGVTLVARTTRSLSLTEAGAKFIGRCAPGLREVLSAIEEVGHLGEKPSGHLRINLSRAAYAIVFQSRLSAFLKAYPEISVEFHFDDQLSDIVSRGFDAGVRLSETVEKDMIAVRLHDPFRFVVAGSPKYFKKYGRPKQPKDLLKHNCIRFRFDDGDAYERWEFEHVGKDIGIGVTGNLFMNDPQYMKEAAEEGLGLIYYLEPSVIHAVKKKRLELVLEEFAPKSEGLFLYFPSRSQIMPKLRAFIDFMRDSFTSS